MTQQTRNTRVSLLTRFAILAFAAGGFHGSAASAQSDLDIPSGIYAIDRTHAYITFSYLHQGLSYPLLRATDIDGELELDSGRIANSKVFVAVAADSIRTNTSYFDRELASPKFFNAGKFPHITFSADRYVPEAESSGKLHGYVTIRGITRPMTLFVTINGALQNPLSNKPVIGVSATGSLNRSDFELDRFIPAVADRVQVSIEAEFAEGGNEGSAAAAALAKQSLAGRSNAG
jgi:polyisoprenoid-binding protein YceI